MAKTESFDRFYREYENWFERNHDIYEAELELIRSLLPQGKGIEIGVGTGRFAAPLGIKIGIEPSDAMAEVARQRGIDVLKGVAESLPVPNESYDFVLMVTTVCFVDDVLKSFKEAFRILKKGGVFIVGFVDKNSPLGKRYQEKKDKSRFYKEATFYSTEEIVDFLKKAGFSEISVKQTLIEKDGKMLPVIKDGSGEGGFVAVRAVKC
ncbi:class I SAM-dependent methyltransferase [Desulfurobacterium sp. TC5-1]|uniref:class I SAM-dependent methyltransferase n=1 Tax=Desulfurobacterium sp. TC5-1 TaxID=1158318 RepID=UPI0003B3FF5B|nr:class I SAM-dependent methyltransferase [Desulfurobacterium sp. TC5-1]